MNYIPSELKITESKELSRAVAGELEREDDEATKKRLNKLFEGGGKDDDEDKRAKT